MRLLRDRCSRRRQGEAPHSELLAKRFGIAHISSGDQLRQHVRDRTPLGLEVKSYVDKGDLVPDGVVMDMLRKPVLAAASGYVLDGFPADRRSSQGILRCGPGPRG